MDTRLELYTLIMAEHLGRELMFIMSCMSRNVTFDDKPGDGSFGARVAQTNLMMDVIADMKFDSTEEIMKIYD